MTPYRGERKPDASEKTPWLARYLPSSVWYGSVVAVAVIFFLVGMSLSAWILTTPDAEVSRWDMDRAHREAAEARSALYDTQLRLNHCKEARAWEALR